MLEDIKYARLLAYLTKQIRKDRHFLTKLRRESLRKCISEEKI